MELNCQFRYFILACPGDQDFRYSDVQLENALNAFHTAKLRKLAVRYIIEECYDISRELATDVWERLDQRLSGEDEEQTMPCLEELHFVAEDQFLNDRNYASDPNVQIRVRKLFEKKLPRCHSKGMMTFSFRAIQLL